MSYLSQVLKRPEHTPTDRLIEKIEDRVRWEYADWIVEKKWEEMHRNLILILSNEDIAQKITPLLEILLRSET
jgi:hypothetical protein